MFLYCIHLSIVNIVQVYIYIIDYIFYCRYMICVYVYIYMHYLYVYIYIYTCIHDHLPNIINQDSHFRRIPCQSLIGAKWSDGCVHNLESQRLCHLKKRSKFKNFEIHLLRNISEKEMLIWETLSVKHIWETLTVPTTLFSSNIYVGIFWIFTWGVSSRKYSWNILQLK
jgi:hypothetical protein